ncbi:MAG: ATP-binding cassette domain-containing protein [Planctomycetes bacterium]|nr:ATP-binding cassette domain-containing protein [Planctomycetota bacterium]
MLSEPVGELVFTGASSSDDNSRVTGRIEFADVTFEYEEGHPVLEEVSFGINEGEHIAITGPSGSGKSTLMALLPRFLEPTTGNVMINERELPTVSINSLRRSIGVVFQEVFLFNASIYENLRYARPKATDAEIIDACKLTGAQDFIQRLPNGYQTKLGESGSELSRGEKQRITLARALIKNPEILILDEATASIDSHTARAVVRAIFERMEGRTVIMVTHETDLLDLADRVVCITDGKVTFDGQSEDFRPTQMLGTPLLTGDDENETASLHGGDASTSHADLHSRDQAMTETDPLPHHNETHPPTPMAGPLQPSSVPKKKTATGRGIAGLTVAFIGLLFGCVSSSRSTNSILMEDPKVSAGLVEADPNEDQLQLLADAMAQWDSAEIDARAAEIAQEQEQPAVQEEPPTTPPADDPVATDQPAPPPPTDQVTEVINASQAAVGTTLAPPIAAEHIPQGAGRLLPLPPLSRTEIAEIIDHLRLKLETENGYHSCGIDLAARLPDGPQEVGGVTDLCRTQPDTTAQSVLRLGYRVFTSQPAQLWVWGITVNPDGTIATNPDVDLIAPAVEAVIASINQLRQGLRTGDLSMQHIKLSHVEQADSLTLLKALGVTTFPDPNTVPANINFEQLPMVIKVPPPADAAMALVGGNVGGGQFGVSIAPTSASALPASVSGSPANELLVLYHPAHPEQYSRVRSLITEWIDRPAQQVFIEGLVLEISQDGLDDLGIQWNFQEGPIEWTLSTLDAGGPFDTLTFSSVNSRNTPRDWMVDIRALIRDGKAEILSRPSVLTLDNRQAAIRVGEDIPIATSQEGMSVNTNRIKFDFKYLPTGIMLNVRPRVAEDGSKVSMMIDTIVSATVPGRDLEIRSPDGELLASAPTVSARRVQTYARINNNTPFIIGGLVSKDRTVVQDKVPLLGDIPFIGMAFRSERTETSKREVIIVLTPYVLPSDHNVARSLPKDEELFDSFGNELFRDAYRIRTEDVFDLKFLLENKRLMWYRDLAATAIRSNFQFAVTDPFSQFANDRVPGEDILVHRMIYEVVKRIGIDKAVQPERLIYFVSRTDANGYSVAFLDETLRRIGGGDDGKSFFERQRGKALAITFYPNGNDEEGTQLKTDPVPEISMIDCPDLDTWGRMVWELNQPSPGGHIRHTILLRTEKDFERLQRAIMLKKIIALNGGESRVALSNFKVGKLLIMPEIKEDQAHVIDDDVARYFYQTEHYYAAALSTLEQCIRRLDAALRQVDIEPYLDGKELPPPLPEKSILEQQ